ncbi:MAG TPA: helicase-related protein, partial [Phycisphaerales bacterium]|nr:helicase-related protein [Phycisphaerales bacterium]
QAYIVAPTIDPGSGDDPGLRAVRPTMEMLERGPLKGLRLAALHGRLKRETREAIMARFRAREVDALVATTVIEVGVDVPNATMMVVNHAERFGLAQLHQLRGRVGRGERPSLAVFIHSDDVTPEAKERLKAVVGTTDGFKLAERDFELRGPGEMMGARQSGEAPFRLAEFPRDMELLTLARRDAAAWIALSPRLTGQDEKLIHDRLMKTHGDSLGLVDVG